MFLFPTTSISNDFYTMRVQAANSNLSKIIADKVKEHLMKNVIENK